MLTRRSLLLAVAAALGMYLWFSDPGDLLLEDSVSSTSQTVRRSELPTVTQTQQRLGELRVAERSPSGLPAYSRDAFGAAWTDIDENGCNQRDDVLLRDANPGTVTVQQQGACPHDVVAGTWIDPYTGAELTFDDLKDPQQAQALQIDHVVALAEAWSSGAHAWPRERRIRFANDLDGLLAVDGPTNAAKGSDDPAAWRPRQAHQCSYAARWVTVKHRWGLTADTSEIGALQQMLDTCPT